MLDPDNAGLRRKLMGRLAGLFFVTSGILGIVTIPISAPDLNRPGTIVVSLLAVGIGLGAWRAPWDRWSRPASLILVPPGFALIASANVFGGTEVHTYGVFFVLAFVWIGMAHPPWTSLVMAPLAAVAYVVPIFFLPGDVAAGVGSVAVTIPLCVLVGESLSRIAGRLVRTEEALRREQDLAEQWRVLGEAKSRFMSVVSHELKTPVTIARWHLESLDPSAIPAETRESLSVSIDELGRIQRIAEDITTYIGISGDGFLKPEVLDIDDFVVDLAAKATPFLDGRLRIGELPSGGVVRADPQRLTQGMLNLLHNAAVHTGPAVPVEVRVVGEQGSWRFEVADRGRGLPPGEEQAVFLPFRVAGSTPGTGLGLAVVRGIAEAHGGSAGVDPRPGGGVVFWIRVPQ